MISKLVHNQKTIKGTALSFAVVGAFMHGLNIMHATNSTISQVWSIVAIAGFFLTMTAFVNQRPLFKARLHLRRNDQRNYTSAPTAKDDIAFP